MRKTVAFLLVAYLQFDLLASSAAAAGQVCAGADSGDASDCSGNIVGSSSINLATTGAGRSSNGTQTNSAGSTTRYIPYDRLVRGADGQGCVTTGYRAEGAGVTDALPDDSYSHIEGAGGYSNLFAEYPPCPQQAQSAGQPPVPESRAMIAARAWATRVPLPKPHPTIAPGRAITGKLAYLETGGRVTDNYTEDTIFGPLHINATGTYSVSWGDGETTGPFVSEGLPWPAGQITHDYLKVGRYDIVVTERWTATWSVGGESGILYPLQTTGSIRAFPVEQIQAVVGK